MKESIHKLIKLLEELEDYLDFTVFYTLEQCLSSRNFCPAFDFEGYYYEIQYDDDNELRVLRWVPKAGNDEAGAILSEKDAEELIYNLAVNWAEKTLKCYKESLQKIERDNWIHYLEGNIPTKTFSQDVVYSIRTEKLTKEEIMDKYKIKL